MAEGFSTLIAHTEAEATRLAVEHLAVAVVNLRLAGDLAGHRVIRFLRSHIPKLPVVVVTTAALAPLVDWTREMAGFWQDRFDDLEDLLKRMDQ